MTLAVFPFVIPNYSSERNKFVHSALIASLHTMAVTYFALKLFYLLVVLLAFDNNFSVKC